MSGDIDGDGEADGRSDGGVLCGFAPWGGKGNQAGDDWDEKSDLARTYDRGVVGTTGPAFFSLLFFSLPCFSLLCFSLLRFSPPSPFSSPSVRIAGCDQGRGDHPPIDVTRRLHVCRVPDAALYVVQTLTNRASPLPAS